ncbi:MAG: DUF3313 domain-containing protein [Deltaproteobacteria bacterium]|nr:DUF3313 domain-containing protein [Deltaproteobacteria bacterium]
MKRLIAFTLIALMVLMVGCARTKQARTAKQTGFLRDYSKLQKGETGEEVLYYKNPKAYWAGYDKILLDPVTVWRGEKSKNERIPEEDIQSMIDNFYAILRSELSKDYKIVTGPEQGALRIQVAITKLEESWETLDAVSNILPPMIVISETKKYTTGKPLFVGEAAIEIKVTDAPTRNLLFAGVDRRVGGKTLSKPDSWDDVTAIMVFWSKKARFRLCQFRGESSCVPPE